MQGDAICILARYLRHFAVSMVHLFEICGSDSIFLVHNQGT